MKIDDLTKQIQANMLQYTQNTNNLSGDEMSGATGFSQLLEAVIAQKATEVSKASTDSIGVGTETSVSSSKDQLNSMLQLYLMQTLNSASSGSEDGVSGTSSNQYSQMMQVMLLSMLSKEGATSTSGAQSIGSFFETPKEATLNVDNSDAISADDTNSIGKVSGYNKSDIDSIIKMASAKYGVDEDFIRAVIERESSFNPNSVSNAGAIGLMQLMPDTAKSLGVKNPYDPLENINGGTLYLKKLMNSFGGSKELALAAYNGGISRMNRRGVDTVEEISKMPKETINYVKKVMETYNKNKV